MRIATIQGGSIYYHHNDHLGTPLALTDSNAAVVWSAAYKPFGEAQVDQGSTVVNNFRFPGQYYDAESGLHYNWHRYYDPKTGRYLTADPIGLEMGFNHLYAYVANNPLNLIDIFGLVPDCPCKESDLNGNIDWCQDTFFSPITHSGYTCYRSLPGKDGQQCCYKDNEAPQANPDSVSPASGRNGDGTCQFSNWKLIWEHIYEDVAPALRDKFKAKLKEIYKLSPM
jgi:RHS repeat-associated protein